MRQYYQHHHQPYFTPCTAHIAICVLCLRECHAILWASCRKLFGMLKQRMCAATVSAATTMYLRAVVVKLEVFHNCT